MRLTYFQINLFFRYFIHCTKQEWNLRDTEASELDKRTVGRPHEKHKGDLRGKPNGGDSV